MRFMYGFFYTEVKRFFSRKNMIAWLIIFLLLIIQANIGVKKIKKIPETIETFKQIQKNYFETISNYSVYAYNGVNSIFIPSAAAILSLNSLLAQGVKAKVNSVDKLHIGSNLKSKSLNQINWSFSFDISVIIGCLITLLAMWYGYNSFHTMRYMKFMSSLLNPFKTYVCIAISRLFLFCSFFIIIMISVYIFVRLRGMFFTVEDLNGFNNIVLASLVLIFFFFISGVLIGSIKQNGRVHIFILTIWLILNFGMIWAINSFNDTLFPDRIQDYKIELEKHKIVAAFEERCERKAKKFDRNNMDKERNLIEEYWSSDSKQIESIEIKQMEKIKRDIDKYNHWCLYFPITFYRLTISEASSVGYQNYLEYYKYLLKIQRQFLRFWIDRVYYNNPKEMVNFIKGDEDIFRGQSFTPPNFFFGILINLSYCFILGIISFYLYKRSLFPNPKDVKAFDNLEITLDSKINTSINSYQKAFNYQFLNIFFNQKKKLNWKVSLDENSMINGKNPDFIYLPSANNIPGELKGKHLIVLFKPFFKKKFQEIKQIKETLGVDILNQRFKELTLEDRARILLFLGLYIDKEIYLLDAFTHGLNNHERIDLEKMVYKLDINKKNKMIIDIVCSSCFWMERNHLITITGKRGEYSII